MNEQDNRRVTFNQLNLLDRDVVRRSGDLLEIDQRNMLNAAFSPYKDSTPGFSSQYFETAALLINANVKDAGRYSRCGMRGFIGARNWCRRPKCCTRCAMIEGRDLVRRYGHCHPGRNWQLLTLSFNGSVPLLDSQICIQAWDLLGATHKKITQEWSLNGSLIVEELAIIGFLPCVVMPHTHILFDCDDTAGEAQIEQLTEEINAKLRELIPGTTLTANVHVELVKSEEHFKKLLSYLMKAIDFGTAYRSTVDRIGSSPENFALLNGNVATLLGTLPNWATNRRRIKSSGHMSGNCNKRIGLTQAQARANARRRQYRRPICPNPPLRIVKASTPLQVEPIALAE